MGNHVGYDAIDEYHQDNTPVALAWDGNCLAAIVWSAEMAESLQSTTHFRIEPIGRDGGDGGAR